MPVAVFDALEDLGIHERFAQPDQHHVLGGISGFGEQRTEHLIGHVRLGLGVGLARAHGAIEIALSGGLDDILHRQRVEPGPARQVAPQ